MPLTDARKQDIANRLRAARALAGYTSLPDFADALNENGLGVQTLRMIEQEKWKADGYKLEAALATIAEFCGLPPAWFHIDIAEAVQREAERLALTELEADAARGVPARGKSRRTARTSPVEGTGG